MPMFSQRKGINPLQRALQIEEIDAALRNRLWNAMYDWLLVSAAETDQFGEETGSARLAQRFARRVWCDFLKLRSDEAPNRLSCEVPIKECFDGAEWFRVYDLMEFSLSVLPPSLGERLGKSWNKLLEEENSGYRIVGHQVVDITSPQEIEQLEKALTCGIPAVEEHVRAALACLSDRTAPNYRNAIKESISAVESICRLIAGGKTLGDALKAIRDKINLHPALEKSFSALYGYTSDKGGIRHALLEESSIDSADARFMLVSCSAFVNFLIAKAASAGIKFVAGSE